VLRTLIWQDAMSAVVVVMAEAVMLPDLGKLTLRQEPTSMKKVAGVRIREIADDPWEDTTEFILLQYETAIKGINQELASMKPRGGSYRVDATVFIGGERRRVEAQKMRIAFMMDQLPVPTSMKEIKSSLWYNMALAPAVQFYDEDKDTWLNIGWFAPIGDCEPGGIGCIIDVDGVLRFELPLPVVDDGAVDPEQRTEKVPVNTYYRREMGIITDFTEKDAYIMFTGLDEESNKRMRERFADESTGVRQKWWQWKRRLDRAMERANRALIDTYKLLDESR